MFARSGWEGEEKERLELRGSCGLRRQAKGERQGACTATSPYIDLNLFGPNASARGKITIFPPRFPLSVRVFDAGFRALSGNGALYSRIPVFVFVLSCYVCMSRQRRVRFP